MFWYCARLSHMRIFEGIETPQTERMLLGEEKHREFGNFLGMLGGETAPTIEYEMVTDYGEITLVGKPDGIFRSLPVEFKSFNAGRFWLPVATFQLRLYSYIMWMTGKIKNPMGILVFANPRKILETKIISVPVDFPKQINQTIECLLTKKLPLPHRIKCRSCEAIEYCKQFFGGNPLCRRQK